MFGDPSAEEGDGGEHGDRSDDGDTRAREAILEDAAEQGRGGRGGGEDSSDRRLNGRSHGGEIYRDGDGDIDIVRRLRSMGTAKCKGQVNDQNGHVGGGHVEAEARETGRCAAARARRGRHSVLLAITCSEEAADALPSWRWQSDPDLPLIVASSLENVSSDWVVVEMSAVAVVLPECACGREIAAYHRSAVSSTECTAT
jgi:hypothetical protein